MLFEPVGWGPPAIVAAVVILASIRPYDGLLLLAGLGPLAAVMFVVVRAQSSSIRFEEALTLAFLAGWTARQAIQPRTLAISPWLRWSVTLLLVAAATSAVVSGAILIAEQPGADARELVWMRAVRESLIGLNPLTATALFAQGLLLLLAAADMCAGGRTRRELLLRMMVIGAAAAAILNLLRLVVAAAQQQHPWSTFVQYLASVRVNIHFGDLNAAASYFALMLFIAAGLASSARVASTACAVFIALGVWISGSRTALAAVLVTSAIAGLSGVRVRLRRRGAPIAAILLVLALAVLAWWKWYPEERNVDSAYALSFRVEMATAGLRMAAGHPLWGIGLGRFHRVSEQYASIRENAHNQFIQVLAELGITGLVLFLAILGLALHAAWRGARRFGPPAWGLLAGLGAFLLTCLAGHPLLVPGAAYPFWIALGVAAAGSISAPSMPRGARAAAIAVLAIFLAALPFRAAHATREAYVEHASIGLSSWHRTADGSRYRFAGGRSTFFVASSARAVRIPMRSGPLAPAVAEVRIFLDGREANRVLLRTDHGWRVVRLLLDRRASAPFRRIDLEVGAPESAAPFEIQPTNTSGVLMVGRPVIEYSMR